MRLLDPQPSLWRTILVYFMAILWLPLTGIPAILAVPILWPFVGLSKVRALRHCPWCPVYARPSPTSRCCACPSTDQLASNLNTQSPLHRCSGLSSPDKNTVPQRLPLVPPS